MDTNRIRELNDRFRKTFLGGRVMLTQGIHSLPGLDQYQILSKVKSFQDFSPDNDPHQEHDFGAFDHGGQKIFWKIDYYDRNLQGGSEDPANPQETIRVLTIMLAREY